MKGRLGKWLAVLLSVSMLAGTAPVYGADISMESDFSSGAAETEEQPDVQEGTEINCFSKYTSAVHSCNIYERPRYLP